MLKIFIGFDPDFAIFSCETNFQCCKWPNIEQIILTFGHGKQNKNQFCSPLSNYSFIFNNILLKYSSNTTESPTLAKRIVCC